MIAPRLPTIKRHAHRAIALSSVVRHQETVRPIGRPSKRLKTVDLLVRHGLIGHQSETKRPKAPGSIGRDLSGFPGGSSDPSAPNLINKRRTSAPHATNCFGIPSRLSNFSCQTSRFGTNNREVVFLRLRRARVDQTSWYTLRQTLFCLEDARPGACSTKRTIRRDIWSLLLSPGLISLQRRMVLCPARSRHCRCTLVPIARWGWRACAAVRSSLWLAAAGLCSGAQICPWPPPSSFLSIAIAATTSCGVASLGSVSLALISIDLL